MIKGFKEFINQGDVVDLSVGVVVGVAFTTLADAFTEGLITPIVRIFLGNEAGNFEVVIAGQTIDISLMISALITFFFTMLVIYLVFVVPINRFRARRAFDAGSDEQVALLAEIRDLLQKQSGHER